MCAGAQKRLVLVEEFTNTGCGPCASWSPELDSAIHYRLGDCIAIKYHAGYPNKEDEFYLYDQDVQQTKANFYGVTGVPSTFIDGTELGVRSFAMMNTAIGYCLQKPVDYGLTVKKQLDGKHLTVSTSLTPLKDVENENLRLNVAVIEEHIINSKPWPNGERELNYTMRKMLTGPDGHLSQAEGTLAAGTAYDWQGEWDIDFFDSLDQLGVVAFVQDIATREILVTAYSGPEAEGENRLKLMNVTDTPDLICTPQFGGKAIIRNDGANTITQATLNVSVNGASFQFPWTGSLGYLERDTISFSIDGGFQLASQGQNQARAWMSGINGTDLQTNDRTMQFQNAVQATYGVRLRIYTDKKPEEITWELRNSAGDVVRSGGPYDVARKFVTEDFGLTADDCYQLTFLDAGGDGIKSAAYGNGYYQLQQLSAEGKTSLLTQGDYTGAVHTVNFSLTGAPAPPQPRLVLFEEFTNTSCDPCAEFSPALDKTIYERLGEMVAITYHWNFPSRQDPFYLANPDDVMARADYYGITGVPSLFVDGTKSGAWGYEQYLGSYVDYERLQAPLADISTQAEMTPAEDGNGGQRLSVSTQVANIQSQADGADLRLFVAVVEERVEWDHPAANGERSWNYVMRKLLPSGEGQQVDATQVTPQAYSFTYDVQPTDFNLDELGIVTFVQDLTTGQVLNAAYTPRPADSPRAAKILKVTNTPDRICTPQFMADLMVRNTGTETLTSATLNARINGQLHTTPWTGTLQPLAIETLRIPAFSDFPLTDEATNDVELWLSDLNGQADESLHRSIAISNAYRAKNAVRLTVMTDQQPEEITWTVFNSAGDAVAQGGPYTEARKRQVIDLPLAVDDCYLLEFEDEGGNGIADGRGYYMLHEVDQNGKTRLLVQQTYSEALHDVFFSLQDADWQTAIGSTTRPANDESADRQGYDLLGRSATGSSHIIIKKNRKTINKQ